MVRLALGLSYDGSRFQGWQTQPSRQTVQDTLEAALAKFACEPVATICAGRTDTGVHAALQVVHFDTALDRRLQSWVRGVNAFLPSSISVLWAHQVAEDFSARFSATARTYTYLLWRGAVRPALWAGRAGWTHRPLKVERMRNAASALLGTHDFSAFRSSQCQAASPVRTLHRLDIREQGNFLIFTLSGNAFLHHMVRNIIGTLLDIGQGRHDAAWIALLLAQQDRRLSAPTFMPDGLYLTSVDYPPHFCLPALGEGIGQLASLA